MVLCDGKYFNIKVFFHHTEGGVTVLRSHHPLKHRARLLKLTNSVQDTRSFARNQDKSMLFL